MIDPTSVKSEENNDSHYSASFCAGYNDDDEKLQKIKERNTRLKKQSRLSSGDADIQRNLQLMDDLKKQLSDLNPIISDDEEKREEINDQINKIENKVIEHNDKRSIWEISNQSNRIKQFNDRIGGGAKR